MALLVLRFRVGIGEFYRIKMVLSELYPGFIQKIIQDITEILYLQQYNIFNLGLLSVKSSSVKLQTELIKQQNINSTLALVR